MAFGIADTVFALSVVLIARLIADVGARSSDPLVMRIDVSYVDDDPASRGPTPSRRDEVARLIRSVEPDPMQARPDLSMNNGAV